MQRLMRAAIGTHNIDNCSRVCHSPTSWALRQSLGLSGATGSFDDIEHAGAAIIIGANPTEGHPVAGARIKQATLRGLQLVTIDPRRIELADYGVLHLSPRPGSNAAVMLGLAHVVARDGLIDTAFVRDRTEGWDALEDLLADYTPADVQRISGVPAADLERAAHIYAEAGEASILWGLGVTEHKYGSEVVRLICNLALMCGKVGRPGSALLPLRGQNNVQGSSDMGALPDTFTGYQSVADDDVARRFEARWGVTMKRARGLKIPEMFDAAVAGELKAMYIFGEDVAQTDPNTTHVIAALEALEFLVVQDIFENETTRYADVVLPASSFLEKNGTFTNAERRIQLVDAAIAPPGEARTDFDILTTISAALGHEMPFASPADAMDEVAALTPDWAGVSHARVGRGGLQWPVAADGTDSPILYAERFSLPTGRARLAALPYKPPGSEVDRRVPARARHRPAPGALQRRHDDPPHRQPRAAAERLARASPRRRRAAVGERRRPRVGAQPVRAHRAGGARHRAHRARPRVHRISLSGSSHEPADRPVGRCEHVVPGVQGRRGRRAAGGRAGRAARRRSPARRDAVTPDDPRRRPHDRRRPARRRARRGRRRGAAGDPRRRRRADRHDAHARPRRGARARLPVRRGADRRAARRRARPTTSRRTSSRCAARCCATRARGASTRRRRAGCAARARSRRSPSTRRSLPDGPRVARALLAALPERLRQPAFGRTGGMHATGLFDAGGEVLLVREDVGRHNAMDKVVGRALLDGRLPLHGHILCVSGRLSFELVQKAAVAGAPILVGVGAPTSLAIELAADRGMTLAGFARGDSVNVYCGDEPGDASGNDRRRRSGDAP